MAGMPVIPATAQFSPLDLDTIRFFVQSTYIDTVLHVARCTTSTCLNEPNTEQAPIAGQYCDLTVCPDGCVRRWPDRSGYVPAGGFNPPEYTEGRNFGQDDLEKPCYVPNCINGLPCVRGGSPYGTFTQDKYVENQVADIMSLDNAFSIFLLCRPINQAATGNWYYLGQAHSNLQHNVSKNALMFHVNGPSPILQLTTDSSVAINEWQLMEVHRSLDDSLTGVINGVDKTNSPLMNAGTFRLGYLFSNFKTTGDVAMYGDIAAAVVYEGELTEVEKQLVRDYFNNIYHYDTASLSGIAPMPEDVPVTISPNPFHSGIEVRYQLEQGAKVEVEVYDLLGRCVSQSPETFYSPGMYTQQFTLSGESRAGIYILSLTVNGRAQRYRLVRY